MVQIRKNRMVFRVDDYERDLIREEAELYNVTVSSYIRYMVIGVDPLD